MCICTAIKFYSATLFDMIRSQFIFNCLRSDDKMANIFIPKDMFVKS